MSAGMICEFFVSRSKKALRSSDKGSLLIVVHCKNAVIYFQEDESVILPARNLIIKLKS